MSSNTIKTVDPSFSVAGSPGKKIVQYSALKKSCIHRVRQTGQNSKEKILKKIF